MFDSEPASRARPRFFLGCLLLRKPAPDNIDTTDHEPSHADATSEQCSRVEAAMTTENAEVTRARQRVTNAWEHRDLRRILP